MDQDTGADRPETLEAMADRLEAALDRIARTVGGGSRTVPSTRPSPETAELAARLDRAILRLRSALSEPAD